MFRVVVPQDPKDAVFVEAIRAAGTAFFDLSRDGGKLLVWSGHDPGTDGFEDLQLFDLAARTSRSITTHGRRLAKAAFDPSGHVIVNGDIDGVVRAGPVTGEEPHLLLGHASLVTAVGVSPDGRWIASASDGALYL